MEPIPLDLVEKLQQLHSQGIVSTETFKRFLENPDLVWLTADLVHAREIALRGEHPQERADMFRDIAITTHHPDDLQMVRKEWERGGKLPASAREGICSSLFVAELGCKRIREAIRLIPFLGTPRERLTGWLRIYQQTLKVEYLHCVRELVNELPQPERVRAWCKIAVASKDPRDITVAEKALAEESKNCDSRNDERRRAWLLINQAEVALVRNHLSLAKECVEAILTPDMRLVGRSLVATVSQEESDFLLLLGDFEKHPALSLKGLRKTLAVFLTGGHIDLARKVAMARRDSGERCFLFAIISTDKAGSEEDLNAANKNAWNPGPLNSVALAAQFELVRALAYRKNHELARVAMKLIPSRHLQCRAYLIFHQTILGRELPSFEIAD